MKADKHLRGRMTRNAVLLSLTLLMAMLSGCLEQEIEPAEPVVLCPNGTQNPDFVGNWTVLASEGSQSNRWMNFDEDGTMEKRITDPDFDGVDHCWETNGHQHKIIMMNDAWNGEQHLVSNAHVDGDLMFISSIYTEGWHDNGTLTGTMHHERPTVCRVYHRVGVFSDDASLHAAINATAFPDFCSFIYNPPSGPNYWDAWNASYLAVDHPDDVSTATNDRLIDVVIDGFLGELDWGISEYYYGFSVTLTVGNQEYACSTGLDSPCIITFSGVDEYHAVWEEGEIGTLSENGVDICSTVCDVSLMDLKLQAENFMQGTDNVSVQ